MNETPTAHSAGRAERAARESSRALRDESLRTPRDESSRTLRDAVCAGLGRSPKSLPPWLFYDDEGSKLFELITQLPEYYLTRAEREILRRYAREIVSLAAGGGPALNIVELGAGTATKSQILLHAAVERQGRCLYVPVDVSLTALESAASRLGREEPEVDVRPLAAQYAVAMRRLRQIPERRLVLFIGSSIGNFDDPEAIELLGSVRDGLAAGDALLLGADRRKSPERLLPAYDDAQGVTAAFNKNVLGRINRELGGEFDLEAFDHVAIWNERRSRIEIYLQSRRRQVVRVRSLGLSYTFEQGERVHTESSYKYDEEHLDRLLGSAGLVREQSFFDARGDFGVHLVRVTR